MDSDTWSDEQALAYVASYQDLIAAIGADPAAARAHYAAHGAGEGRMIGFDASLYAAGRPELFAGTRVDLRKAALDCIRAGRGEPLQMSRFPLDYQPPGEAGATYRQRVLSGFLDSYCAGPVILDVGFSGYDNPDRLTALPGAIGIDLDYPGYDGIRLPFADASVDTVFSSHCLEHIDADLQAIRDWYRVLRIGGFIVCMVPSQAAYEKKRSLPSRWNGDHKRMYTPAILLASFEAALKINSYRVRHLRENIHEHNRLIPPDRHGNSPYEIELVIEKVEAPDWELAD